MTDTARLITRRKRQDLFFNVLGIACMSLGIVTLGALLIDLLESAVWDPDRLGIFDLRRIRTQRAPMQACFRPGSDRCC